jgi:alkanesulfonate monooxygenase SsuD/methylene tetrahydromethanopterin reductase-like flavin-dependent oxidoreductase (luciferase family)
MALMAIALRTSHMRLGPLVTPLPRRRPVKLARETVTLDHLSDGRLVLGVGIGAFRWEWDDLGEEADLAVRGEMLDEGLDVLQQIWSGRPVAHEGTHYRVHIQELPGWDQAGYFQPAPVQQPRIPIWVAGMWPNKKPFRRAARWDGVVPLKAGGEFGATLTPADLAEIVRYVGAHRGDSGPFDVVAGGHTTGIDRSRDAETVAAYERAGATWWLESVSPWDFGWQWQGSWPEEEMRTRVRAGPPRL